MLQIIIFIAFQLPQSYDDFTANYNTNKIDGHDNNFFRSEIKLLICVFISLTQ